MNEYRYISRLYRKGGNFTDTATFQSYLLVQVRDIIAIHLYAKNVLLQDSNMYSL